MAKPRQGKGAARGLRAAAGKKRKAKDDFFEAEEDGEEQFFQGSDDEAERGDEGAEEEEEEELEETADEKRLRLAKAYLERMHALDDAERDLEGGSGSEAEEAEEGGRGDGVAERLRRDALEGLGHLHRKLAHRVVLPPAAEGGAAAAPEGARLMRGHRLPVTALALSPDDATVYSVSKGGTLLAHNTETGARDAFAWPDNARGVKQTGTVADWVKRGGRRSSQAALLAAAVSSDGRYLAVGGGDAKVHVWDARSRQYLKGFPGHKDAITALAFREGTGELFSGSLDRSIKLWSLDDMAYMDTLFGHQAEVLALDALRAERALSAGADRTCRVWKVAEESQLIFRGHCPTIEAARYVNGREWVTGSADGSVALWATTKKKPVMSVRGAHPDPTTPAAAAAAAAPGGAAHSGAGSVGGDAATWVGAVAACRGSDLVASGAGDGLIRLWGVVDAKGGKSRALSLLGGLPARGFANSLAIAHSGRFVVAGMGQEPRLGRWLRDPVARNGVLLLPLELAPE